MRKVNDFSSLIANQQSVFQNMIDLEESENHLKRSKTRKTSHLNEVAIL